MSRPADGGDSPTIEPLRIFKPQSPQSADGFRYPVPPSAFTSSKPTFPLPPGASSSANPLPYPDDEDHCVAQPAVSNRPSYPDDGRHSSSPNPVFHSPTGSTGSGSSNGTSSRLRLSPVDQGRPGLAERRGTKPTSIQSPTKPDADQDGLFAKPLANQHPSNSASWQTKPYYPPPGGASSSSNNAASQNSGSDTLKMPADGVNRYASTASTSTTRASRGSPPPPETPIVEPGQIPGGGIEARYAAAGISGDSNLERPPGSKRCGSPAPGPVRRPAAAATAAAARRASTMDPD